MFYSLFNWLCMCNSTYERYFDSDECEYTQMVPCDQGTEGQETHAGEQPPSTANTKNNNNNMPWLALITDYGSIPKRRTWLVHETESRRMLWWIFRCLVTLHQTVEASTLVQLVTVQEPRTSLCFIVLPVYQPLSLKLRIKDSCSLRSICLGVWRKELEIRHCKSWDLRFHTRMSVVCMSRRIRLHPALLLLILLFFVVGVGH